MNLSRTQLTNPGAAADKPAARAVQIWSTYHDREQFCVGMLWAENDTQLPNKYYSALVQLKSLKMYSIKTSV